MKADAMRIGFHFFVCTGWVFFTSSYYLVVSTCHDKIV